MESAFAWVSQLWEFLCSLVPHLENMPANYGGVKLKHGKAKEIRPGLYWWLPLTTDIVRLPTKRQTMRLDTQTLTTTDDQAVTASAVVVYEIADVVKALVDTWDVEDTISDVAQRSVVGALSSRSFEEVREELTGEVAQEILRQCRRDLRQFGIRVKDAFLSDCTFVTAYRIMGDGVAVVPHHGTDD